jgi:hypothetical protein
MASSPSGLQVPVLFKSFGSQSYSISRGNIPGPRLCSVACPCGGHLTFRLAFTVRGPAPRRRPFQLAFQLQGKLVISKHGRCLRPCSPCISRVLDDRPGYRCTVTIWCGLMLYWLTREVLRRVRFRQVWLRVLSDPTRTLEGNQAWPIVSQARSGGLAWLAGSVDPEPQPKLKAKTPP